MKLEVTSVSVSKKGTVWMQVKLVEGETPTTGEVFECTKTMPTPKPKKTKEPKDEKSSDLV